MKMRKLTIDERIDLVCGLKHKEHFGLCKECGKIFKLQEEEVVNCPSCDFALDHDEALRAWQEFTDGIKV